MPLVLGFTTILGGLVLTVAGITGSTIGSVAKGKPDKANARTPSGAGEASTSITTGANVSVTGSQSQESFAKALLEKLGIKPSKEAIAKMVAWENQEGGNWNNTAKYNPLNTTLTMPGSSVMAGGSSAGVQAYTSWQQGLEATAKTLDGYPEIIKALKSGSLASFEATVTDSKWGTHF